MRAPLASVLVQSSTIDVPTDLAKLTYCWVLMCEQALRDPAAGYSACHYAGAWISLRNQQEMPAYLEEALPESWVFVSEQAARDIGVGHLQEVELGGQGHADSLLGQQRPAASGGAPGEVGTELAAGGLLLAVATAEPWRLTQAAAFCNSRCVL